MMVKDIFFDNKQLIFSSESNGRMDVMGGIADYSGSLLLQKAITEKTKVILSLRTDGLVRIHSSSAKAMGEADLFEAKWDNLYDSNANYSALGEKITKLPAGSWASYVVGCIIVLYREKKIAFEGADIWIDSEVPFGKGVSSSAAIEVATMKSLQKAFNVALLPIELSVLAQKVENQVVGAPCGLMDQLACNLANTDALLPIVCQPHQVYDRVEIPHQIKFVGLDSGMRHSVGGASYGDVRIAAFMGYTIIAKACGATDKEIENAKQTGDFNLLPYQGFLANIKMSEFDNHFKHLLPDNITGKDFINAYGAYLDKATHVIAQTAYPVKVATTHPIYEQQRVSSFLHLLKYAKLIDDKLELKNIYAALGELMYLSHQSYSACGLGSNATDEIVDAVKALSQKHDLFGAKITGGGSGGTVCVLCDGQKAVNVLKEYFVTYQKNHGFSGLVFFE